MSTDRIIEILNGIREDFEMEFSECEHAKECEICKECYAYEAAKALSYAIKAVKSAQALSNAVERLAEK
jgi:hypothetical protein